MPLSTDLEILTQRTGASSGTLQTVAQRTAHVANTKADIANLINQLNTVYYPLMVKLAEVTGVDPQTLGLSGNAIYTHVEANSSGAEVYYDSGLGRKLTIKETVDVLLAEIARIENAITAAEASAYDDTAVRGLITANDLDLDQVVVDAFGDNYTLDGDGLSDLSHPLAQIIDAVGNLFNGYSPTGLSYTDSYPTLSLAGLAGWGASLLIGETSNGTNPVVSDGDLLSFGTALNGYARYSGSTVDFATVAVTDVAETAATVPIVIETGIRTVTNNKIGTGSGAVTVRSGNTTTTDAGGTAGDTGEVKIYSGLADAGSGTSGDSGQVFIYSGDSDEKSGDLSLFTGASATNRFGRITITPGAQEPSSGFSDGGVLIKSSNGKDGNTYPEGVTITSEARDSAVGDFTGTVSILTGNGTDTSQSGDLSLRTGTSEATTGAIYMYTGTSDQNSGGIFIHTADTVSGDTGNLDLHTGSSTSGGAGGGGIIHMLAGATTESKILIETADSNYYTSPITIRTGDVGSDGSTPPSGAINILTGDSTDDDSGDITITTGASPTGTRGAITLDAEIVDTIAGDLRYDIANTRSRAVFREGFELRPEAVSTFSSNHIFGLGGVNNPTVSGFSESYIALVTNTAANDCTVISPEYSDHTNRWQGGKVTSIAKYSTTSKVVLATVISLDTLTSQRVEFGIREDIDIFDDTSDDEKMIIRYDSTSANWYLVTSAVGVDTVTDTGVPAAADTPLAVKFSVNAGGQVTLSMNDVIVVTGATNVLNPASEYLGQVYYGIKTAAAAPVIARISHVSVAWDLL
jgi:hypothetical protein